MLCHDRVYVIRRHGKGDTGETNLNCQKSMGRKPSLSKIRILRFLWRNVSVKNKTPAKSKFYVFYGEMLHIYPRNHAHIMIFYAIFFLPNTLQPSRAYFLTPARYICFPRSISIQQTTSPIIEISAVPQVFKWTLHPKPVVGHIESWNDPWMGEKYA